MPRKVLLQPLNARRSHPPLPYLPLEVTRMAWSTL